MCLSSRMSIPPIRRPKKKQIRTPRLGAGVIHQVSHSVTQSLSHSVTSSCMKSLSNCGLFQNNAALWSAVHLAMPLATTRPSHFRICGESLGTSRFSTTPLYGLSSVFIVTELTAAVLGVWFDSISVVFFFLLSTFAN